MFENTLVYGYLVCAKRIRISAWFQVSGTRKSTLDLSAAAIGWCGRGKLLRREFGGCED
jgi:hypothetical protein